MMLAQKGVGLVGANDDGAEGRSWMRRSELFICRGQLCVEIKVRLT